MTIAELLHTIIHHPAPVVTDERRDAGDGHADAPRYLTWAEVYATIHPGTRLVIATSDGRQHTVIVEAYTRHDDSVDGQAHITLRQAGSWGNAGVRTWPLAVVWPHIVEVQS